MKEKHYLMSEEEQTRSDVTVECCRELLQTPGVLILIALGLSLAFRHCLRVGGDFWLTRWTDDFDPDTYNATKEPLVSVSIHCMCVSVLH